MRRPPPPHAIGTDLGGIRSIEGVRLRCHVDECRGCWIWKGAKSNGLPSMRLPAIGRTQSAGAALCFLVTGALPARGVFWYRRTGCDDLCVNPKHRRIGSRSEAQKARVHRMSVDSRARMSQSRRRIPAEVIDAIRISDEPVATLAARYGMCERNVYKYKRQGRLTPVVNSVFSWAGAR